MTGPELAERIIRTRPGIRLLFMSGYTDKAISRFAQGEHQVEFLQKPFTPDTLTQCVRKVLDAKRRQATTIPA